MKLNGADENAVGGSKFPPNGRYKAKIIETEATASKAGSPMIKFQGQILEPAEFAEWSFYDNAITDETKPGAAFGKKKLRALGVNVDSEVEIADQQIAEFLLGRVVIVDLVAEQRMGKDAEGDYTVPQYFETEDGRKFPKQNLVAKAYYQHDVGGKKATAPAAAAPASAPVPVAQAAAAAQPAAVAAPSVAAPTPGGSVPPWAQGASAPTAQPKKQKLKL